MITKKRLTFCAQSGIIHNVNRGQADRSPRPTKKGFCSMRDFDWTDAIFAVVKEDGTFAGVPCLSLDEAKELANNHEGSQIYRLVLATND